MERIKCLILLLVLIFAIFNSTGSTLARAQSDKDIMIKLDNATFSPLTYTDANQLTLQKAVRISAGEKY